MGDDHTGQRRPDRAGYVDADQIEPGGRPQLRSWYELGNGGRPRGQLHRCASAEKEGKGDEQGRRHLPGGGKYGEQDADAEEVNLNCEQQPASIEGIGQYAAREREHHDGQRGGRLHERDECRRIRCIDHQPLRADGLHPGAGPADQNADPQPAEGPTLKRRPSRSLRHPVLVVKYLLGDAAGGYRLGLACVAGRVTPPSLE
jgi:hypothetical protein